VEVDELVHDTLTESEPWTSEIVGSWGRNEGRLSDSESEMVVENLSGEGGVASVI
jgi:hypothetical protein